MFTGIIQEVGSMIAVDQQEKAMQLTIASEKLTKDMHIGDSIAVNGVCLTVTSFTSHAFRVDVMPETFRDSSLSNLRSTDAVNLEPALQPSGRLGGHFVSGHVDTTGTILSIRDESNARYVDIGVTEGLQYLMKKGSVSVDGVSLTVFDVQDDLFTISLIPETRKATILGNKKAGDLVNLEFDQLAKYMERLMGYQNSPQPAGITTETLAQHGFMD
ncbi:riboflavin synthase [Terribacillus halophilus]|uniref:Riboflavin synthase n=1 Tax=Terribacillus halophilus TaxID=361279 RepID=A0A1G6RTG2_9BACI|nr:riboflavin synthase [Terribacillus halophilus]SDD07723.1 riboflavin synthase [Terribacillus halophilus]